MRRALAAACLILLLAACNQGEPAGPTPTAATTVPAGTSPAAPAETTTTAAASPSPAAATVPRATGTPRLQQVGSFSQPIHLSSPPGDPRIFIVERRGRIVEMVDGRPREPAFLDIARFVSSGGERGLFSIAFAPDYASTGLAYVSYTDSNGDSRIDEFRANPPNASQLDPGSRRQILGVDQPFGNHNGGLIAFDLTGMLMIGLGDGGSAGDPGNRAQNLNDLLGKFLRIDPRNPSGGRPYGIPSDNPFVGRAGARPEVWAYGLRNPWRWWIDPDTRDLFVGDVGQNELEEINYVPASMQAGANYGWPRYEASRLYKDVQIDESRLVRPVIDYPLSGGNCAVTGGGVYRGSAEQLRGVYLYGDYCVGLIRGFRIEGGRIADRRNFDNLRVRNLASFGVDSSGEMYALSLSGPVYRITAG